MSENSDESVLILQSIGSPMRLSVLELLEEGGLRYNDLMRKMGLNQKTDAGKFSFHVKKLMRARLIELNPAEKKYQLTKIGESVLKHVHEMRGELIEETSLPKVRTTKLTIEPFERRRIVDSLTKEARLEEDEAEDISLEVQDKIYRLKPRYLTSPLIRELVVSTLMERGLERFRFKMTRLGMPLYDVGKTLTEMEGESPVERAGREVLIQYVLLELLPRNIADAHMSGELRFNFLADWALRPDEIIHDPSADLEWFDLVPGRPIRLKTQEGKPDRSSLDRFVASVSAETANAQTLMPPPKSKESGDVPGWNLWLSALTGVRVNMMAKLDTRASDSAGNPVNKLLELGKVTPLTNLEASIVATGAKEIEFRRLLDSAASAASLGARVLLSKKPSAAMTYDGLFLDNLYPSPADYHGLSVLGSAAIHTLAIVKRAKDSESRFFDRLRALVQKIRLALEARADHIVTRMEKNKLPILSSKRKDRTFMRTDRFVGAVIPLGVHETAVTIANETDWHSKSSLATVEKILNSIRASMDRESTDRIILVPALTCPASHSTERKSDVVRGYVTRIDQDNLEDWLEREMALQRSLMGRSTLWVDLDASDEGPIRSELALRSAVDSVIIHAERRMCSECGSIVAETVPVCPYCGSRSFLSQAAASSR